MSGALLTALVASALGLPAAGPLIEGRPDSAVRVVIYEDLQCLDCADFRRMMDEKILPKYGGTVAFAHRDFPLAKHAWARRAAIAARYFGEIKPELALEWRRQAMAHIQETTPANFNEKLTGFAQANRIDPARALAALDDKRLAELVESDFQSGVARGIAKTPTVLVNGKPFIEHFRFEDLSQAIDEALAGR